MRIFALLVLVATAGCSSSSTTTTTPPAAPAKPAMDAGADALDDDAGDAGDAADAPPMNMCSAVIATLLTPIAQVSTGAVTILSDANGVRSVYVDASAGGFGNDGTHPRVYVNLETATRVDITDDQAATSTAWDLAIKRPVLFTNDGDGGPGMGGTLIVSKAFDAVTAADATGKFATESFTDDMCTPKTDPTDAVLTTLSNWYDYDQQTNILTPMPNTTYVIGGGTGKLYKVEIDSYYGAPDGGTQVDGGEYLLKIGAL